MNNNTKINCWLILFVIIFSWGNLYAQVNGNNETLANKEEVKLPEKSWKKLNTERYPGKQDDITFINEKEGWYVNGYGSIYHTKNGGETWEKQLQKKGTFLRTIAKLGSLLTIKALMLKDFAPLIWLKNNTLITEK